ncbi:hypothetical protein GPALN_004545 [Globodera pallida]|nr:hypothetical protein GPALN_004545 [Globodera pallida]
MGAQLWAPSRELPVVSAQSYPAPSRIPRDKDEWGQLGAHDWALTTGRSQLRANDWALTTGRSQLGAHDWALTTGRSQLGAHNWAPIIKG